MGIVRPHLWFAAGAEHAARFYASVIPNSRVVSVTPAPAGIPDVAEGAPFIVHLLLDGMPIEFINAGPVFRLNEAFSLLVECENQAEIDHYWAALLADGGEESQCGWLKDRFGVSWQVVPRDLEALLFDGSPGAARATAAMLTMRKLDVEVLRAAARDA